MRLSVRLPSSPPGHLLCASVFLWAAILCSTASIATAAVIPAAQPPAQLPQSADTTAADADSDDDSIGYIKLGERNISNYCIAELAGLASGKSIRAPRQVLLKDCQRDAYWKGYACLKNACPRDAQDGDLGTGSFDAQLIGVTGDIYVIEVNSSGGGEGEFSQVIGVAFDKTRDALEQKMTMSAGDRANGGITDADVRNGVLIYSRALTPFDIVDIATDQKHPFKADDSIEACAECYAGSAQYHLRPGIDARGILDGIDVNYDYSFQFEDSAGVTECLMDVFADEAQAHHDAETGHYEGAALNALGDKIVKSCGKFEKKRKKHSG